MLLRFGVAAGRYAVVWGALICASILVCATSAADEPGPPTNKLPLDVPCGHSLPVRSIAYSRDGKRIVTGGEDRMAIVWDAATGRQLASFGGSSKDPVNGADRGDEIAAVAISIDGRYVATGSERGVIVVWDTNSHKKFRTLLWHLGPVVALAFRNKGAELFSASLDKTVVIWSLETGLKRQMLTTTSPILGAALSPNEAQAATDEQDGGATLFDVATGKTIHTLRENEPPKSATDESAEQDKAPRVGNFLAFSRDGKLVVAATPDKTATLWKVATGEKLQVFAGSQEMVNTVGISADDKQVIAASYDRAISGVYNHSAAVWDIPTGKKVLDLEFKFSVPVGMNSDSSEIVVSGTEYGPGERLGVTMFSSETGKPVRKLPSE